MNAHKILILSILTLMNLMSCKSADNFSEASNANDTNIRVLISSTNGATDKPNRLLISVPSNIDSISICKRYLSKNCSGNVIYQKLSNQVGTEGSNKIFALENENILDGYPYIFYAEQNGQKTYERKIMVGKDPYEEEMVPNPEGVILSDYERQVIRYTNQERVKKGKHKYIVSKKLMDTSRGQSEEMFRLNRMQHGLYPRGNTAENIHQKGAKTPQLAVYGNNYITGWMTSSGHYNNIMGNYKYIGVADSCHLGGCYWTQQFGSSN